MINKIESLDAPRVIGPYSQAVLAGQLLFISGQLPINPKTSKIESPDIDKQTTQVLANLEAILKKANLTFKNVVRAEIYLKDLSDFSTVNEIYGKYFPFDIKPARQTMQVAKLPMDARIEISCIAFKPDH